VAAFWDSFAKDEMNHAEMIQEIQRSLTRKELSALPTDDQWESLLAAEDFLACPQIQSVQDLEDAYELAHEIENYELVLIFQLFVNEAIGNNQLVDFMKAQLDEHLHRLEEIGTQWGSVATRRAVRFLN
jgi:rubrerythrin